MGTAERCSRQGYFTDTFVETLEQPLLMFGDNLVDFINYVVLDSDDFNNVDWNKNVYNESFNPESNSLN